MKKIISMILVLILMLSLSVTALAWSTDDWFSNVANTDVVNGAPSTSLASHKKHIILYNTSERTYYYMVNTGTGYSVSFNVDANTDTFTMTNNNSITFNVYKYDGSQWVQQTDLDGNKNVTSYVLSDCLFVSSGNGALFNIDNVQLDYTDGNLSVDGQPLIKITSVVFTGPSKTQYYIGDTFDATGITAIAYYSNGTSADVTNDIVITIPDLSVSGMNVEGKISYDIWTYTFTVNVGSDIVIDPGEDLSNQGFFNGLKSFFVDLFKGLVDLGNFIVDCLYALTDMFFELPKLLSNLIVLKDSLFNTLGTIWTTTNGKARAVVTLASVSVVIAIINLFLKLFGGSKLGGD